MTVKPITALTLAMVLSGCRDPLASNALRSPGDAVFSDHGDLAGHPQADLTDMHVFVNGANLVVALSTNPGIPRTASSYQFPSDVTFDINIDTDSEVFDDPSSPTDVAFFGGTVRNPGAISEEITIRIRFDESGAPSVERIDHGKSKNNLKTSFFAGLRDEPFIRTARNGRNVAAIVIELPLNAVLKHHAPLLIWATSKLDENVALDGQDDLIGRPLGGPATNHLHPRDHLRVTGLAPNVLIYDTSRPARFPNGRALEDDVIDIVCLFDTDGDGDQESVGNCGLYLSDMPAAFVNDVAFLTTFPYLAPPHAPL